MSGLLDDMDLRTALAKKPLIKYCVFCKLSFDLTENGCGYFQKYICGSCLNKLPITVHLRGNA
jgi:hypothetical protein